jgi:hypothetical protein
MKGQERELNPYWIAGFVDGEGTFFISIYDSPKLKMGKQVRIGFKVTQGVKNVQVLYKLKKFYGIGIVKQEKPEVYEYRVNDLQQLVEIILPFFLKYAMHTTKKFDFLRVLYVSKLMLRKDHLTMDGINKIQKIRNKMNLKR